MRNHQREVRSERSGNWNICADRRRRHRVAGIGYAANLKQVERLLIGADEVSGSCWPDVRGIGIVYSYWRKWPGYAISRKRRKRPDYCR